MADNKAAKVDDAASTHVAPADQVEAAVDVAATAHAVATGGAAPRDGEEDLKGSRQYLVLHTLNHDTDIYTPGDKVTLSRADGVPLVQAGTLFEGTGKEAKDALQRADDAREAARRMA